MQLCSCLATAAEGKHEQIAAIPTLFLVLEAWPCKCYFFSSQQTWHLPTLFQSCYQPLSWLPGQTAEKFRPYQAAVYLKALLPQKPETQDKDPFAVSFSHTETKGECKPLVSHRANKHLIAWIFHSSSASPIWLFIENARLTFFQDRKVQQVACYVLKNSKILNNTR